MLLRPSHESGYHASTKCFMTRCRQSARYMPYMELWDKVLQKWIYRALKHFWQEDFGVFCATMMWEMIFFYKNVWFCHWIDVCDPFVEAPFDVLGNRLSRHWLSIETAATRNIGAGHIFRLCELSVSTNLILTQVSGYWCICIWPHFSAYCCCRHTKT